MQRGHGGSDQHQRIAQHIYLLATDIYRVYTYIYIFQEKATENRKFTPMPHYQHIQDITCQHAHIGPIWDPYRVHQQTFMGMLDCDGLSLWAL